MKIFGRVLAAVLSVILLFGAFVLWASSGSTDEYAWVERYEVGGDVRTALEVGVDEGAMFEAGLSDTITIMTYNVGYLSGMTNNRPLPRDPGAFEANLKAVVEAIRRTAPDIIGFQEIDVRSSRSFEVNQVAALAERGRYAEAAVAVNWDERYVPFPSAWPRYHFGRMLSSQAVLSRYPITEHRRVVLPSPDSAPIYEKETMLSRLARRFYIERLAQVSIVDAGRPIAVVNVHLEAFDAETRERQSAELIQIYRDLPPEYPAFVIGDFNTVMPSAKHPARLDAASLERFRTDTSLERFLVATGMTGALPGSAYTMRDPSTYTFSSAEPRVKIDHILYEPDEAELIDAFVMDVEGNPSDHRPVVARFVVRQ